MMTDFILPLLSAAVASGEKDGTGLLRQDSRPKSPSGHDRQGTGGAARRAGPVRDRKLRPLLAAAGLALASAAPAGSVAAAALVVDKGNSGCSDTSGVPFCTIGGAAAKTNPGDTVQVRAGTYNEKVAIKRSGAAGAVITFAADPGVTVTGQTAAFDLASVQWVTVQGFGVGSPPGSRLPTTTPYGLRALLSSNFPLANNQVVNSGGYGIYVGNSS